MNLLATIGFYVKRLGFLGSISYIGSKITNKKFDAKDYMLVHYYPNLKSDDYYTELTEWYHYRTGRNKKVIDNPVLFNDKIQWLKLYDQNPLKTICSDKYKVREYINGLSIPDLKLIPLLGCWDNVDDIDFDSLPDSFVLKQNAGCKMNIIVKDKQNLDIDKTKEKLKMWLNQEFGYLGMELQYLKIPRVIIAEEYLKELDGNLYDYKFFCFNGTPKYVEVIGNRDLEKKTACETFFDMDWNQANFSTLTYPPFEKPIDQPVHFDQMTKIAEELSKPFKFVRVDLYNVNGNIYFGELTFTPTNGVSVWSSPEAEKHLGDLLKIKED